MESDARAPEPQRPGGEAARGRWLGLLVLGLAVVASAAVRIQLGLGDPSFDAAQVERMLKSDPALLYYITERILDSGGAPPADFRADPRVEHPGTSDLPAMFSVGQEFLAAWLYPALGGDLPLHVFCVVLFGIVAALATLGVYGLAWELSGRVRWAALAAVLYVASPAAYRTAGFILIREDLSLPLFSLHLYLLARAARVGTRSAYLLSGMALLAALSSWHAMGFVVAVEVACLFAWFLRSGENPLLAPAAWLLPAVVALGSLMVPMLWSKGFLLSLPALLTAALAAAALADRRAARAPAFRIGVACGVLALLVALVRVLGAGADYAHVYELMWAKLRFLGERPADPRLLSFDARLLWQGPFVTPYLRELVAGATVGSVLLPVAVAQVLPDWWRGRGDRRVAVAVLFALACAVLALLLRRNLVLFGLLAPTASVLVLARLARDAWTPWLVGIGVAQLVAAGGILPHRELRWYLPEHQDELAAVVAWMRDELPGEGAVAADFVNSTALLAHLGRPIVLQPKYETRESRLRSEEFLRAFFFGTSAELRDWLRRYECRYLLVDRPTLWGFRYVAGLSEELELPVPGTAAAAFLSGDPRRSAGIPGFRLLYQSPLPSDAMRLYEVE